VQEPAKPLPNTLQVEPVHIAFVYPGEQASDYWRRSVSSFKQRMDELAIQYELKEYFSKGGGVETRKQERQLKEALDQNPDWLVFTLDVNQHQHLIERILAKGSPRLILQNITTPLRIWEDNQPFYVGFDHAIGTEMLADYFLEHSSSNGRYGLLYYSQGYISTMRGDTFRQFMQEGDGPVLSAAYYTDGQRQKAKEATKRLLHDDRLEFIYACSTDVALGAIDGLKEGGDPSSVMVNGWGGGSAELAALERGELEVTVMRMNDDNGVAMAEAIHLTLLGKKSAIPTVFSGDFALVTRTTSKEEIAALKQQAFRYSGPTD
jgi:autoinducer 2-binding protein LuxP